MKYWLLFFVLIFFKNTAYSQMDGYFWRKQYCVLGDFYLSDNTKQHSFGMMEIDFKKNTLLFDKKYLEKYTHILVITQQHKYKLKSKHKNRYKDPYDYDYPYPHLGATSWLEIHEKLRKEYKDQMGLSLESPKWLSLSAPDYLPLELFEVNFRGKNVPIVGLEGYLIPKTLLLQQEGERTFDASDVMQFSFVFNTQGKKRKKDDYENTNNDYYQRNDLKITFKKGTHLKVTYKTGKILSFEEKTMKDKQIKLHVKIK